MAWEAGSGYFFWSYKLISEPDGWDFRNAWRRAGSREIWKSEGKSCKEKD